MQKHSKMWVCLILTAGFFLIVFSQPLYAAFPDKPITIIVGRTLPPASA